MAVNSSTVNYTVSEDRYSLGTDNYTLSMVFTSENTTSAGKTYDASPPPKIVLLVVLTTISIILVVSLMIFSRRLFRCSSSICNARKNEQKAPEAEEEVLMTDSSRKLEVLLDVDTKSTKGSIQDVFISSKFTNSSRNNTPVDNKMFQYSAHTNGDTDAVDDQVLKFWDESYNVKTTSNIFYAHTAFDETNFLDGTLFNNLDTCSLPHAAKCSNKSFVTNLQSFTSLQHIDEFSHLEKGTYRREIVNNRKATSPFQSDICSIPRSAFLIGKEQSDDDISYSEESDLLLEHNSDNKAISCRTSEWNECRRKEKVETDILLTSPEKKKDQEETAVVLQKKLEDISQIDTEKIDWNKVFIFLCERLGTEWRLFFLRLYGFSIVKIEMIDDRMSQIEETTRRKPGGYNSQCIIFDQFRAWKASEGSYASHLTICETLRDMNRNDLLHTFEEFIRKLPLVHYESQSSLNSLDRYTPGHRSDTSLESIVNGDMHVGHRLPNGQCRIMHKRYEAICITTEHRQGQGDGEEENETNTEPKRYAFQMSIEKGTQTAVENVAEVYCQPHVKEHKLASSPSLTEISRKSNGEERKINQKKFKQKRKKKPKHLYLSTESLSSDTFYIMAKALLESQVKTIPRDMYETFVRNLILDITQETSSSDITILSLKVMEFQLNLSHQTLKETIYSLYAGEKRLILGTSVFERLSLYVNEARKRIVDKLPTEDTPENYVFIAYEGKPLLEKIQSETAAAATGSDLSSDDSRDISVKEPSSSSSEENSQNLE